MLQAGNVIGNLYRWIQDKEQYSKDKYGYEYDFRSFIERYWLIMQQSIKEEQDMNDVDKFTDFIMKESNLTGNETEVDKLEKARVRIFGLKIREMCKESQIVDFNELRDFYYNVLANENAFNVLEDAYKNDEKSEKAIENTIKTHFETLRASMVITNEKHNAERKALGLEEQYIFNKEDYQKIREIKENFIEKNKAPKDYSMEKLEKVLEDLENHNNEKRAKASKELEDVAKNKEESALFNELAKVYDSSKEVADKNAEIEKLESIKNTNSNDAEFFVPKKTNLIDSIRKDFGEKKVSTDEMFSFINDKNQVEFPFSRGATLDNRGFMQDFSNSLKNKSLQEMQKMLNELKRKNEILRKEIESLDDKKAEIVKEINSALGDNQKLSSVKEASEAGLLDNKQQNKDDNFADSNKTKSKSRKAK